ncbi:hypothetical protein F4778DRAFT_695194 [Xylariomycetidae sp. FL2044]|nr:hypothetical protein F4778DRAFT_695194 [Xylariomycetidae sp. FL2044]
MKEDLDDVVIHWYSRDIGSQSNVEKYWRSKNFSNATIVCKQRSWDVHTVILAVASPFFEKTFLGFFKVSFYRDRDQEQPLTSPRKPKSRFWTSAKRNLTLSMLCWNTYTAEVPHALPIPMFASQ